MAFELNSPAALAEETLRERIALHSRALRWMPLIHVAFVVVVALLLFRESGGLFGVWAAAMLGVEVCRAAYGHWTLIRIDRIVAHRVHWHQILLASLSGAVVGALSPLFMAHLGAAQQALLVGILAAFPALGVSVAMASRYVAVVYGVAVMVPTAIGWSQLFPQQFPVVLVANTCYVFTVLIAAAESERTLRRSVEIRRERDQMVIDLERSNAEVRSAVTLAQSEAQARSSVLASASHDLRQPLHALSAYSAVLTADPTSETLHEVAAHVDQIVKSLGDLLHGLLDLARLSGGSYVPNLQQFDLGELMTQILGEYRTMAADKGLDLTSGIDAMAVHGDALGISRITRNLLDNAIKYTDRGAVTLSVRRDAGSVVIEVSDTGKGIPVAEQERVFEEFYQIDNPARDRTRGVGLGLAIVQRLAKLIGAHVQLHSEVGRGTRFVIAVPDAFPAMSAPVPAPSDTPIAGGGRRIYVIDDEIDIQRSVVRLLTAWQMEACAVGDAVQAHQLFERAGPPDLLIADLRLSDGASGVRLVHQLRDRHGDFAVLAVTGETGSTALQEVRNSGWTVLSKPVHAERLRQAIHAALAAAEPGPGSRRAPPQPDP